MSRLLIKNAKVLSLIPGNAKTFEGHVLVEDDIIREVYHDGDMPSVHADATIDAAGKLLMPGLVNAHCHSSENMLKGLLDNMPLELWMLYSYPPFEFGPFSPRLIYLRTLLGAIEMIRGGITTVQDDVTEWPTLSVDGMDSVMQAYLDIGMRANVAGNLSDKPFYQKLPFIEEKLTPAMKRRLEPLQGERELLGITRELVKQWHQRDGRIQYVVAPSAPQRCTESFLLGLAELADHRDLQLHTHILETRMQRVTGSAMYGKSLIEYMANLGLLSPRLTIIHSVWVSDSDVELMGRYGVTVAHNPASNLKLGSGIMPLRKLLEAGVNVALGSDGMSSNDSQSIFESMKLTALLHKITHPDYRQWPTSEQVLSTAIQGGARSTGLEGQIGKIAPGMKADMILLDTATTAFTPWNDVLNHLVYCENGSSVDTVIVAGKVVMEHRKLTTIDERAILEELRSYEQEFAQHFNKMKMASDGLFPLVDEVYWQCVQEDVGLNRWARDEWGPSSPLSAPSQ